MYYKDRKDYYIYLHISPSNKYYVGYSCQKNPNARWRYGKGYCTQPLIWEAIQKYGWDNFQHKILKTNLTFDEANYWEIYYISQYKSNDRKYGYNLTPGGSNPNQSEEAKLKNKIAHTGLRFYRSTIYQYNKDGILLNIFRSYREGEEITGINLYRIASSCNKKSVICSPIECCFSKIKLSEEEVINRFYNSLNTKYIYQYDLMSKQLIGAYPSLDIAKDITGISRDTICISCSDNPKKDKGKSFPYGYIFRHNKLSKEELDNYVIEYINRRQQAILNRSNQYGKCNDKNIKS